MYIWIKLFRVKIKTNKFLKASHLLLFFGFACVENKIDQKEAESNKSVSQKEQKTLQFDSGVRAILQDSKANYWIGSRYENLNYKGNYLTCNRPLAKTHSSILLI